MAKTTILGLLVGLCGILFGNYLEGGHLASLAQGAAFVIVMTGTAGAVIVSSRQSDLKLGLRMLKMAFKDEDKDLAQESFNQVLEFVRIARREGPLALEPKIKSIEDPFMQKVLRAVVDGIAPEVVRDLFEKQITIEEEKLMNGVKIWTEAGGYSPTIGIIGAVLGLIHVMSNLADTSKLGAGIAVAFVATIYGVAFANLIYLPLGTKLKKWVHRQILIKEMILEGVLCIPSGLNPQIVETKLEPFVEKAG